MIPPPDEHEMHRWRGQVDEKLDSHGKRLDKINGSAENANKNTREILVELAVLKTKVGLYSAAGGVIGAGAISFVIQVLT